MKFIEILNILNEENLSDTPEGRKIWKDGVDAGKQYVIDGEGKPPKTPLPYHAFGKGNVKWNYWNQAFEAGRSLGISISQRGR